MKQSKSQAIFQSAGVMLIHPLFATIRLQMAQFQDRMNRKLCQFRSTLCFYRIFIREILIEMIPAYDYCPFQFPV